MHKLKMFMITMLVILTGAAASAAASGIDCSVSESGQYKVLSGKITPESEGRVTLVVNNAGRPLGEKVSTVLIDEGKSNKNGEFSFTFRILDEMYSGVKEFDYYLRTQSGEAKSGSFLWADTETKNNFIDTVKGCSSPDDMMAMLNDDISNIENRQILDIIGFDLAWYDGQFNQAENTSWMASLIANPQFSYLTSENFAEYTHSEMAAYMLKNGRNIQDALLHTKLGYESLSGDEQSAVVLVFANEKPNTASKISETYQLARELYKMKNGNANDIYNSVLNMHTVLGLDTLSSFAVYAAMTNTQKYSVCDALVSAFKNTEVASRAQFAQCFNPAVQNVSSGSGSNQGAGSSGGGGGGGASYSAPSVPVTENAETEEYYSDLNGFEWAEAAIKSLTDKNILSGDGTGRFNPADNVTREQFLTMLVRAAKLNTDAKSNFDDVSPEAWFYPFVSAGVECGITVGLSDTEFGIGVPIIRQDAAVMLKRVLDYQKKEIRYIREYAAFADQSEISDYAAAGIEMLYRLGAINGYEDNTLRPKRLCTRAEAAVIIYSVFYGQEG